MQNNENRILEIYDLEKKLNYSFKDKNLLNTALIHKSYANENQGLKHQNNERLEFLGDAVLELVFTKILFEKFIFKDEGYLTKLRASLVCEQSFFEFAEKIDLKKYILLGHGEETTGGREKPSIISDAFEAVSGAMYLDSGFDEVFNFVKTIIEDKINNIDNPNKAIKNYKSILQEFVHKSNNINIRYELISESGPAHDKKFVMAAFKGNNKISEGFGKSKKEAEQDAAKNALIKYKQI